MVRGNVIFDDRSPVPGAFNIEKFPFLRQIQEVLSPRGRRSSTCTHPSPRAAWQKEPNGSGMGTGDLVTRSRIAPPTFAEPQCGKVFQEIIHS